jgi:hypothetical protein
MRRQIVVANGVSYNVRQDEIVQPCSHPRTNGKPDYNLHSAALLGKLEVVNRNLPFHSKSLRFSGDQR